MLDIYFILYNLTCIIMLIIFKGQMKLNFSRLSSENKVFTILIYTTIFLTVMETFACWFDGTTFSYSRAILQISNLLYYESFFLICFLWFVFVFLRLDIVKLSDRKAWPYGLPFLILALSVVTNPFTGFIFTINEENLYERNLIGLGIYWSILFLYIGFATVLLVREYVKTKNDLSRRDLLPLIFFLIGPTIVGLIQSAFPNLALMHLGLTVAIGIVCLEGIQHEVSKDALTGINNRHGLYRYLERLFQKNKNTSTLVGMIDINNLKVTNDKFGHNEGDKLISTMATLLSESCDLIAKTLFLCRHGGDEFVIVGTNCNEQDAALLASLIDQKMEYLNEKGVDIGACTGFACGMCRSSLEFDLLMEDADNLMYEKKKARRASFTY